MIRRTFEEMITYFNQTVSEMDIEQKYKMTLLGMVTALLQRHDEDVAWIVRCKDCKHWKRMDNLPEHYGECLDSVFGDCAPREDFLCADGVRNFTKQKCGIRKNGFRRICEVERRSE